MKLNASILSSLSSSLGAALIASVACSSGGDGSSGSSGGASGTPSGSSGSAGAASGVVGNSGSASSGSATSGTASTGSAAGGTTGTATGSGVGPSSGDGSDAGGPTGAMGVMCSGSLCAPPLSCCQTGTSAPVCIDACTGTQQQLCTTTDDCQSSGTAMCVNGICTDSVSDAGIADVGTLGDGGIYMPSDVAGNIPAGYPMPTPATRAMCQTVTASGNACQGGQGPSCIECLFGGSTYNRNEAPPATAQATMEAGEYAVTVQLGGPAAGLTTVTAESSRGLLAPVATKAGETVEYAFTVDVRPMEGQPNHAGGPGGYPGLDLFFSGPTATPPQVTAIGYSLVTAATKPIMVFIASDSTTCDQTGNIYGGWGQMLPEYFGPPVDIANYANSGAGGSNFAFWSTIKSKWSPGDWVIVQFGHNDKPPKTDADEQGYLERYVTEALAANVTPIVVSPPARATYQGSVLSSQASLHEPGARAAAAAHNVAFVPLTTLSTEWYNSLGSATLSQKYHPPGETTHTNLDGARILAGLVAGSLKSQNVPLAKYLR